MRQFLKRSATLFGVGLAKKAPGTWGTLATLPFVWLLMQAGPFVYMAFAFLLLPVSIMACEIYEQATKKHDMPEVVIDEALGIIITMTWLPISWQSFAAGFILFRVLDIFKPFPIGYLDRKVKGGLGVVVDDVVAGILANIVLQIVYTKTTWLGVQVGF